MEKEDNLQTAETQALNIPVVMCRISCTRCNQLISKDEKHVCRDIALSEWRNKKIKMLEDAELPVSLIDW